MERLQKYIAETGFCSRRQAEALIEQGRVSVDGTPAYLGMTIEPGTCRVAIDGKTVGREERQVYIMLNKPRGYVTTTSDEKGRHTVMELVGDVGVRLYPVGRLDMFSQGLLLLTNDGALTKFLTHPSHDLEKKYQVRVTGDLEKGLSVLQAPMSLDGKPLKPCRIRVLNVGKDSALLMFCISEGRNRQIRRMCEIAGLQVVRLRRVQEAGLSLGDLPEGKWRYLTGEEIARLKKMQELH